MTATAGLVVAPSIAGEIKLSARLPSTVPEHDAHGIWALQQELITLAESLLGKRDHTKKIYQPAFQENGPRLEITLDGAFVVLGRYSKVYWPTVICEMAHETVHLLNPILCPTNWLEEGVATEFSIYAQNVYSVPVQSPEFGPYFEALTMVRALPSGALAAANKVRKAVGALSAVSFQQLRTLFPSCDSAILRRLSEKFATCPRPQGTVPIPEEPYQSKRSPKR